MLRCIRVGASIASEESLASFNACFWGGVIEVLFDNTNGADNYIDSVSRSGYGERTKQHLMFFRKPEPILGG